MQIVRALGGYTLGRSDLLRRAMSKKKAAVMEKERQNFVYGNEEEGVAGCIKNGIPETVANKIYDEMIDFAKYAFNKSHAACYAVVAYQTAWLKYYYPVEFMAALMTSVIDNPPKVAEYILTCRQMGIELLPPDINKGESAFSVEESEEVDENGKKEKKKHIRYGLSAIKSIGKPVIDAIVKERTENGYYKNFRDFVERLSGKELNKRTIESFIKAGALDGLCDNRKQLMLVYVQILDSVNQQKKYAMTGQMSLFDIMSDEMKQDFEIKLPNVEEYDKEQLLAFEKEVLGVYISGHPLEKYEQMWRKNISAVTLDFAYDDESHATKVIDGAKEIIGGMVEGITIKHTKTNKMMAFLNIEDLLGTVEVVVFPRDYEKYRSSIVQDAKIFIQGRVSAEEEKSSKLICEKIWRFDEVPKEIWIQFPDKESFVQEEKALYDILRTSDGTDQIVIYIRSPKSMKKLGKAWSVCADETLLQKITGQYGQNNVKVVEKCIENKDKMN